MLTMLQIIIWVIDCPWATSPSLGERSASHPQIRIVMKRKRGGLYPSIAEDREEPWNPVS